MKLPITLRCLLSTLMLTTLALNTTFASAAETIIPGERSCFWYRGPHSADPYINVAYPDANVFYWASAFTMPEGSRLEIEGQFPHSRYFSLISYDAGGRPLESLADYLVRPEPGAENPFRVDARRDKRKRDYRVEILNRELDESRKEGVFQADSERNVLHAFGGQHNQQILLYRIYLPNADAGITGGVSLPEPVLTLADGTKLRGEKACDQLATQQQLQLKVDAMGIPVAAYRKLINQPGKPDTWPAKVNPQWHIQLDRESLLGIYTGKINPDARRSEGGFFPNPDNNYIRTIVNRRHGPVLVLRGKMPTTPATVDGERTMTPAQLRYWSICSNQGFANTRVNDCLFDEEVPLDANGYYTIVVSREADRPRNARRECGLAWLPMADDGDGVFDKDASVVQIRNMLASPDFPQAVQRVQRDGDIEKVMGEYYPKGFYTVPNIVETAFPCAL